MARTPKHYHHGKSPAAWAGSITAAVGSVIAAGGAMLGPNWALVIFGALIVIAPFAIVGAAAWLGRRLYRHREEERLLAAS